MISSLRIFSSAKIIVWRSQISDSRRQSTSIFLRIRLGRARRLIWRQKWSCENHTINRSTSGHLAWSSSRWFSCVSRPTRSRTFPIRWAPLSTLKWTFDVTATRQSSKKWLMQRSDSSQNSDSAHRRFTSFHCARSSIRAWRKKKSSFHFIRIETSRYDQTAYFFGCRRVIRPQSMFPWCKIKLHVRQQIVRLCDNRSMATWRRRETTKYNWKIRNNKQNREMAFSTFMSDDEENLSNIYRRRLLKSWETLHFESHQTKLPGCIGWIESNLMESIAIMLNGLSDWSGRYSVWPWEESHYRQCCLLLRPSLDRQTFTTGWGSSPETAKQKSSRQGKFDWKSHKLSMMTLSASCK